MTNTQQAEEIIYRLSDLYYVTITGKKDNGDLVRELVEQLRQEGYAFQIHQGTALIELYQKLQTVVSEKGKAINDKWYERADALRHEELRLIRIMEELAYFSITDDKIILFLCARREDEWIGL